MYRLHANLKGKGNIVNSRQRSIQKRALIVSDIEQKWLSELIDFGYCVCDSLFAPPHYVD